MTTQIDDANELLRAAVAARREAQAAGKPHKEWYGGNAAEMPTDVTEPMPEVFAAEETESPVWLSDEPYPEYLERWKGSGLIQERPSEQPGSLPFLELLEELRTLHLSKSQDYGSESDPLANIRQGAELVGIEPWRGCMVRVADKVQRLKTYCRTGRLVHEGVRDTLLDLAAYSLLAIVLFDEGTA
jgi:hypothetical protein